MQGNGQEKEHGLEMQLRAAQDSISSLSEELEQARVDLESELEHTRRMQKKAQEVELELTSQLHAAERSMSQFSRDLEEANKELRDAISELTKELDGARRSQEEAQALMQETVKEVQQTLEKTSKEEIGLLHQRMAELVEEREESRQHHKQQIAKLEEEVLAPLRQQLDAETSTSFERSCEVGELSKELETSRQRVAELEEKECSQRLQVCEMYTIDIYSSTRYILSYNATYNHI
jgi:DNA repair exonuclease SbcCD ATPase subunit